MLVTYGSMPSKMPAGFFKAVRFPVLAMLDTNTGDGRIIDSAGFSTRDLPLSIRGQFTASSGHDGAVVTGTLFEVTVDPDGKVMSGRGFLLNDPNGRQMARYTYLGAMRGNSVDLAEVKARFEEDMATGEFWVRFTQSKLAATTGVCTPAFGSARAEIDGEMSDEDLVASMGDPMEELVVEFGVFGSRLFHADPDTGVVDEILAAYTSATVDAEAFHHEEPDRPQKIVVTAEGHVFGHLGLWDTKHDGMGGSVTIPRPTDGYASFNKPGVLTDRGMIQTGPIFAYGGHRRSNGASDLDAAYGGIENAWADIHLTEGKLGPWGSGIVRPGTPDTMVYAARASRISGHWIGRRLKAIVSVNAEGFEVPGDQFAMDIASGSAFSTRADGVLELVAGFPASLTDPPAAIEPEADVVLIGADLAVLSGPARGMISGMLLDDEDDDL